MFNIENLKIGDTVAVLGNFTVKPELWSTHKIVKVNKASIVLDNDMRFDTHGNIKVKEKRSAFSGIYAPNAHIIDSEVEERMELAKVARIKEELIAEIKKTDFSQLSIDQLKSIIALTL